MRFLIAINLGPGAVSQHFTALAKELVDRGNQVVLLCPGRRHDLEEPDGNPAIYTWPSHRPTLLRDGIFLHRLLAKKRFDCLIGNFVAVNWICLVGAAARVPHRIAWYHTLSTQIDQDAPRRTVRGSMQRIRKRLVYKFATAIVGNSRAAILDRRKTYGVPARKCHVLGFALPDPMLNGVSEMFPKTPRKIVCAGRLHASKGQDVLIQALGKLIGAHPELSVEFLGVGPMRAGLEALATTSGVRPNCEFIGAVPHHEVLERMRAASFTVVPSRTEAFGLVNIESLSVGTPVVGSRVGGIEEIINDGLDGFLFKPGDVGDLADKMLLLWEDHELRSRMSLNARNKFLAEFAQPEATRRQADYLLTLTKPEHLSNA